MNRHMYLKLCTLLRLYVSGLSFFPPNITRKCTTLWGEPERIHKQNMEQLHAYDCHQNVTEPRATEIIHCESGLAIIYKHAAHRLVQHRLQVVEMAWTDDSTLAIFFYLRYR